MNTTEIPGAWKLFQQRLSARIKLYLRLGRVVAVNTDNQIPKTRLECKLAQLQQRPLSAVSKWHRRSAEKVRQLAPQQKKWILDYGVESGFPFPKQPELDDARLLYGACELELRRRRDIVQAIRKGAACA